MDFIGSVAQQNVNITTDIVQTASVGGNFFENVLYLTNRFEAFSEGTTPEYPVVTKDNYADVLDAYTHLSSAEKKIVKNNLASLFEYASVTVYIIPPELLGKYKYKAYFTYVDIEWLTAESGADYSLSEKGSAILNALKENGIDKDFTGLFADVPVDPTKVEGTSTTSTSQTVASLNAMSLNIAGFARPAYPSGAVGTANAYLDASGSLVSASPALYQFGRSLSRINGSGTPVGNAFDMDAVALKNVLPNGSTDTSNLEGVSVSFAGLFEEMKLNYFKPVGNGTNQITNFGAYTLLGDNIGANWMVAYMNFMNRVACATIITSGGRSIKNAATYSLLLRNISATAENMIKSERLTDFVLSAPAFSKLPATDGQTITIPNAWSGVYLDNVRYVNISGSITVAS